MMTPMWWNTCGVIRCVFHKGFEVIRFWLSKRRWFHFCISLRNFPPSENGHPPSHLFGQVRCQHRCFSFYHYNDVTMDSIASQITSLTIVYSAVYSGADQRKHQSSTSLAFVRGIHRGPVNSPHKWPVTRKMFPFDDVIIISVNYQFLYFR